MTLAQHSSQSVEWYTPPEIVEAARETMGVITLDPASSARANETVRATRYLTQEENGLGQCVWQGNVFLNPPGGKINKRSQAVVWWECLIDNYLTWTKQAVFVAFSLEFLQTAQQSPLAGMQPSDFPICIPKQRLKFLDESGQPQRSPTHANAIIYLPPSSGRLESIGRFQRCFSPIGNVIIPARY